MTCNYTTNLINEVVKTVDFAKFNDCENSCNATDCVDCCIKRYRAGTPVEYKCSNFLKIYLIRYLPVHIHENLLAFREMPQDIFKSIEKYSKVRLLSLGGGPGSDIVAFKRFLEEKKPSQIVEAEIVRVDREEKWNELASKVLETLKFRGVNYSHSNIQADVLSNFINESKYNFISMSYIISELGDDDIKNIAKNILLSVNHPTVIVINDRGEGKVKHKAYMLFKELGIDMMNDYYFNSERKHCGIYYDEDIRKTFEPKLTTSSIRYTGIIKL